mmetsp:Transcript_6798/g.13803  ORF Transcript_6798/g.13803 Transcript_6798/m.13803 type:complete len:226 (-) Transcript_6798:429-1106(-)
MNKNRHGSTQQCSSDHVRWEVMVRSDAVRGNIDSQRQGQQASERNHSRSKEGPVGWEPALLSLLLLEPLFIAHSQTRVNVQSQERQSAKGHGSMTGGEGLAASRVIVRAVFVIVVGFALFVKNGSQISDIILDPLTDQAINGQGHNVDAEGGMVIIKGLDAIDDGRPPTAHEAKSLLDDQGNDANNGRRYCGSHVGLAERGVQNVVATVFQVLIGNRAHVGLDGA